MTSDYMHNPGGIDPSSPSLLQLPTTIIGELVAPASSTPDVSNAQPDTAQPTATAAATVTPSPRPRDSQVPASTTNHIQAARGGDPIGNVGPPDMAAQYVDAPGPQVVTPASTVTVTVTPGWTPTKVLLGGSLAAVMLLAVIAMLLLSRRGRPMVSRNNAPVVLGDGNQLGGRPVATRGGPRPEPESDGNRPEIYARGLVDGAALRSAE